MHEEMRLYTCTSLEYFIKPLNQGELGDLEHGLSDLYNIEI